MDVANQDMEGVAKGSRLASAVAAPHAGDAQVGRRRGVPDAWCSFLCSGLAMLKAASRARLDCTSKSSIHLTA